jgi:hypothetical protein
VSKSGKIEALPSKPSLSAEAIDGLSKAVVDIVKEVTTGQNYTSEICVTLIGQNPNIDPKFGSALYECVNLLRNDRLKDEGIMKEGLKKSEEKVINKSVTGK